MLSKFRYKDTSRYLIILDIFFLLLLSVIPFLAYNNVIIPETDLAYNISPSHAFFNRLFLWDNSVNLGIFLFNTVDFYNFFNICLHQLNIPPQLTKQIWLSFLLFVTGLSMYYFIGVFFEKKNRLLKLVSSTAYMYSLYMVRMIYLTSTFLLSYMMLPLLMGLYIKGLRSKKRYTFYAVLIGLSSVILSNINFTLIAINIIAIFLFLLVYIFVQKRENLLRILKFNILILIFTLLISFWWIVAYTYGVVTNWEITARALNLETPKMYNIMSSYLESFRLLGEWSFYGGYKNILYFPFSPFYIKNNLGILSSFLLTIISICGLLFLAKKKEKKILYLLLLLVVFLPLAVGAYPIKNPTLTGKIYLWFYKNIPLFSIFRNGYKSVAIIAFVYAVLIGYFTWSICFFLKRKLGSVKKILYKVLSGIFVLLIFGLILLNSFPLWTGKLFDKNRILKSIPPYWYKTAEGLNANSLNFRIFYLPDQYFPVYYWGRPITDVGVALIDKSHIQTYTSSIQRGPIGLLYDSVSKESNLDSFVKMLSLVNTEYVIQRNDINWEYYNVESPDKIKRILNSMDGIHYKKSFGEVDLYQIDKDYFLPYIYSPKTLVIPEGDINTFPQIVSSLNYQISPAIYFKDQNKDKIHRIENFAKKVKEINEFPILEFKKVNPVKYIVRVHNASEDFPLVFSESFNKGWRVYLARVQGSRFKVQSKELGNYKILEGNEEDQATKEELAGFIEKGWVSTLGDGIPKKKLGIFSGARGKEIKHYKYLDNGKKVLDHIEKYRIDFISKNFKGTIQNNNLPSGRIWDTWFKKPIIDEENHFTANGYANSWWIDIKNIKSQKSNFKSNSDGSIDFELIIEFWPQRLFYLGLLISGITLFGCVGYLDWDWQKKRKKKLIELSKNEENEE